MFIYLGALVFGGVLIAASALGGGTGRGFGDLTGKLIAAREQIKAATGIDLAAAIRGGSTPPPGTAR